MLSLLYGPNLTSIQDYWKSRSFDYTDLCLCSAYRKVKVKSFSHVQLFGTPWTVAYQASPSMGFSREEYWNRLPFPSPEDLPDPGIKLAFPALAGRVFTTVPQGKPVEKSRLNLT